MFSDFLFSSRFNNFEELKIRDNELFLETKIHYQYY
jgi:hypothetical protein